MKTVCFIPIKLNNERTPGKNLKRFGDGTPLISLIERTMLKIKGIDEIYVYCSDDRIQEYIPEGIRYLKRPDSLDTSAVRCNDIIEAFVNTVKADIYVMAHATSPFVTSAHIQQCVDAVKSGSYDSAYAAVKMQNFVWYQNKPLNFSIANNVRTQDMEPIWVELSTPFVFTRSVFELYKGRTGVLPYRCECSNVEGIDIDYPEDFALADLVYGSNLVEV